MTIRIAVLTGGVILALAAAAAADDAGRIYGRVATVEGDVFEGFIRWDKNEGSWVDILDANKQLPKSTAKKARRRYRDRETTVEIFGLKLGKTWTGNQARSGIRFGHIGMMEVIDDDAVVLTLKSGQEVKYSQGSTDIGGGIREIIIEDRDEGELELVWDDLETIDFMQAPSGLKSSYGERLYGTLTTRRGDQFTGSVCWDVDELFTSDILDGEEGRRKRKVKFGNISAIERYSSSGARVIFDDGDDAVLRGTNDVNDDNRGIAIADPNLGQVSVKWDDFDRLDFGPEPKPVLYNEFDGGRRLEGTVYTEDGESYTGTIQWDADEEYTWEILNGDYRDIDFDIELGMVKSIEKRSYRSSIVTLRDGRSFRLRGSNDVDEDNKGIFVTLSDGEEVEVEWEDFDRVEFD